MRAASLAAVVEQRHIISNSNSRPGDILVQMWERGKAAAFDISVSSSLCKTHVDRAAG
ncbi:MAG: hypothetical protein GY928_06000 [Colwellia sp.]|nr:hypothetical protein [Colwellia sp.]